jgi:organic radical activating enzyme
MARQMLKCKKSQSKTELPYMKKHLRKVHRSQLSLGDLILAVSSCSRNSREAAAAVADLLESGQVRLLGRTHKTSAHS